MTVKMSSEGDSAKNLSSESKEKSDAELSDSSQDAKDAKSDAVEENSVEKKNDEEKEESAEEEEEKADKKVEKLENRKSPVEKPENSKSAEKKDEKSKQEKKEEEDEEEKSEETEDSEKGGEDDKEVPLLDQPLEKSGKRERKNVQRFTDDSDVKEVTKVDIPNGNGTALGNIPRVDASISRFKNDDMKLFHRILFKTPGKTTLIKKNVKKFCGFDFKKDSEEYSKKVGLMAKSDVKQLKSICEMLDLQKTGSKDDIIERILVFLVEPKDSGKAVGGGRPKRTAAVRANNRGYSSHDNYSSDEKQSGRSARAKGKRSNLKDDSSSASDEDFEPSDEGSDEKPAAKRKRNEKKKADSDDEDVSEVDTGSSEDSDEEPKPKRKKPAKANNKGKGVKRGRKSAVTPKKPAKGGRKKNQESSDEEEESDKKDDGSSSEDEPLAKKASKNTQPPTDDEIKNYVKEILEGANLEKITMKTVCQQVYAHYPDFDLAHKKEFIKSTVRSLIST